MTAYDQFQLNTYGNILPDINQTPQDDLFESGIEELNRLAEWMDVQSDLQLQEVANA